MREIWTPPIKAGLPDVHNPLDMAMHLQREIETQKDSQLRYELAKKTLNLLILHFEENEALFAQSSVGAKEALIESTDQDRQVLGLVNSIGLVGDIHGFSYLGIEHYNFGIVLDIEAEYLFSLDQPDDGNMIMRPARVPIRSLEYIEYGIST